MRKWLFVLAMLLAGMAVPEGLPYSQNLYDCDSMYLLRKYNQGVDTIKIVYDTNYIDTFLADSTFDSAGLYILELLVWPENESYSLSGWDMVYNTYGNRITLSASVDAPADSVTQCRMYGYVRKGDQGLVEGARVTATWGRGVLDTCNNVILAPDPIVAVTDSTGKFYLDLTKSRCIKATDQKVTINISFPGATTAYPPLKVTVPDSASCWFIGKD